MPKKVLHLLSSNHFSGAENVACQIIDIFKNDHVEMAYCCPDGPIKEALKEKKILFYPINSLCLKEVKSVIKVFQPDIIHAHDVKAGVVASLIGKKASIISHMHVNHENMGKFNLKTILYLISARKFKHIFWVSKSAYDNYVFKTLISSKSSILCNVINREQIFEKMRRDKTTYCFDIIYVGRLTYQKNPERLINIINLAVSADKKLKVAIVGAGDLFENTKMLSDRLGLWNNVSFLGYSDNPLKIIYDSKVMLMTSRYEGTPMCALEAMALGVPIVSTPTDGMCDLVMDGVTGFLSDNDDILVNKLVEILDNNELQKRLSKAASTRFNEINDIDYYRNALLKVYKEM